MGGRQTLVQRAKNAERTNRRLIKDLERLKNEKNLEILEAQETPKSKEQETLWRQLMDSQEMQDIMKVTQLVSFGSSVGYAHAKVYSELSEEQQKAVFDQLDVSYAIFEQKFNNCYVMDYWTKTEQNNMFKLKHDEIKKPVWK